MLDNSISIRERECFIKAQFSDIGKHHFSMDPSLEEEKIIKYYEIDR